MTLVAGVDSSTQSCKVVVVDADTGAVVREGRAPHPDGTEVAPEAWWTAFEAASAAAGGLDDVAAVSVGGQQHGMVCLDESGAVVRDALLWNDTRSAHAAEELVAELGGAAGVGRGGRLGAGRLVHGDQAALARAPRAGRAPAVPHAVCLPHDWLTWRLRGTGDLRRPGHRPRRRQRHGLLVPGDGRLPPRPARAAPSATTPLLPRVLGPSESAGHCDRRAAARARAPATTRPPRSVWTPAPGDVVVSIGTSGVACAVSEVAGRRPDRHRRRLRRRHRPLPAAGRAP